MLPAAMLLVVATAMTTMATPPLLQHSHPCHSSSAKRQIHAATHVCPNACMSKADRQTDGQTDRRTDRQTD